MPNIKFLSWPYRGFHLNILDSFSGAARGCSAWQSLSLHMTSGARQLFVAVYFHHIYADLCL